MNTILNKAIGLAFSLAIAVSGASFVSAQTNSSAGLPPTPPPPGKIKPIVQELRKDVGDMRNDRREAVKTERDELRSDVKTIRENIKTGSTTREEARQEIKNRVEEGREAIKAEREETREAIQERRGEVKNEIEKIRTERIGSLTDTIIKRYNAAYNRLVQIRDRITSRIDTLAEKGADVSVPKTKLAAANSAIDTAKNSLTSLETAVNAFKASTTDKAARATVQDNSKTTKESMKVAHSALIEVVAALKPGQALKNASSTPKERASTTGGN